MTNQIYDFAEQIGIEIIDSVLDSATTECAAASSLIFGT